MNSVCEQIYSIRSDSRILLNKQPIYKEQTVQQWHIRIRKGDKKGWYMSVHAEAFPQSDQPVSKPFHGLLELLGKPTARLELFFDDQWCLLKIVNKASILSCWQETRKEITNQLGESKEVLDMIKEKERVLDNLEMELSKSIGYLILFHSFRKNSSFRIVAPSVLSVDSEVDVRLSVGEKSEKDRYLTYEGTGALSSLSVLKKIYNEQVKPYADNAPFAYRYTMQINYLFNDPDGMLEKAVTAITEQACEQYVYNHNLSIERM